MSMLGRGVIEFIHPEERERKCPAGFFFCSMGTLSGFADLKFYLLGLGNLDVQRLGETCIRQPGLTTWKGA
jgi:hypothetical protein